MVSARHIAAEGLLILRMTSHILSVSVAKIKGVVIEINRIEGIAPSQKGFHVVFGVVPNLARTCSVGIISGHRGWPHAEDAFVGAASRAPDLSLWGMLSEGFSSQ